MGANKYDSATLVLNAAGGYKAGKIYALKPASGAADPSFTRNSVGNRASLLNLFVQEAIDLMRINYELGDARPRFLFEPVTVNDFLYTESLDNAYFTKDSATVSANAAQSPRGTMTADKLVEGSGAGQAPLIEVVATHPAGVRKQSTFARANGRRYLLVGNNGNTSFPIRYACFDLQNGVVVENGFTAGGEGAYIKQPVNGMYECVVVYQNTLNIARAFQYIIQDSPGLTPVAYTGNGVSGIDFWGVRNSAGFILDTYIGSTDSAGTRAVDSMPLNSFQTAGVFAANEGCFFIDLARMVSNNAGDAVLTLRLANNTEVVRFIANGVANQYLVNLPTLSASSAYNAGKKIAVAWNGTNVRISQGGSIVATINGALGAVDQLRYTGTGLLEAYEMLGYNAAPTNSDLNALTA